MTANVAESINAVSRLAHSARKMERVACMRAMCLYCAEDQPAERMQSSITHKWYWVHGHPLNRCDAGPIRDLDVAATVQHSPRTARPNLHEPPVVKEYPKREIYAYGRYIPCQILNWESGEPPRFLVCNPLDRDLRETFLAAQGLGTWMRIELAEALRGIDALMLAIVDSTWSKAMEDASVPSTNIAREIIKGARASVSDLQRAATA